MNHTRAVARIDHSIRIYLFDRSFDHRFSSIRLRSSIPPFYDLAWSCPSLAHTSFPEPNKQDLSVLPVLLKLYCFQKSILDSVKSVGAHDLRNLALIGRAKYNLCILIRLTSGLVTLYVLAKLASVFRTVQSVRPGGRTGQTAGGSPSFFESMDGLWKMRLGPNALRGPIGPCRISYF